MVFFPDSCFPILGFSNISFHFATCSFLPTELKTSELKRSCPVSEVPLYILNLSFKIADLSAASSSPCRSRCSFMLSAYLIKCLVRQDTSFISTPIAPSHPFIILGKITGVAHNSCGNTTHLLHSVRCCECRLSPKFGNTPCFCQYSHIKK